MIKTTDDVDWNAVEKYYSQYSLQELEEMTYPKKNHQRWFNESADTQQRIRHIRFD
jgi:hypothetical protein